MVRKVGLTLGIKTKADPYRRALRDAGLEPMDVTTESPVADLAGLSGLVLAGGSDIEPHWYGQENLGAKDTDPERDELELRLSHEALDSGMPVLAICRGMQLLNVALGGTLHQDIGETHRLTPPVMHGIGTVPGTRLHSIVGEGVETNSRHHQAVDSLAKPLICTATAPDGTVEGIEMPGEAFVVGVQWHPEDLEDRRLFIAFAEAVQLWK